MKQKVLITAALPYANGQLHFGHIAGAYLPADCYARFERMQGKDVLFISGSDEYGVAITLSAELAGRSPQAHVDHFHKINHAFFKKLNISFDHYSRTTNRYHQEVVQEFFLDLYQNGLIEVRETEELYSEEDKKFLADRYVMGVCPKCSFEGARGDECGKCGASYEAIDLKNPRSKITGAPLKKKKTSHLFLLFDRMKEKLSTFLEGREWKGNVLHFAKQYIEEIRPRAISRDLEWGVPIPLKGMEKKVFYVWFDAPIGYITATMDWSEKEWDKYWLDPQTKYVEFMGKDNIPFHALFFPAMIMGQNKPYKLVDELVANEFYNLEGKQFSKSDGWTIDLEDFFKKYHVDQIRYMIAATAPETGDSEFTWKEFQMRCNVELLGKLGNLVNRTLVFIQNHCGGKIPTCGELSEVDLRLQNEILRHVKDMEEHYNKFRLRKACQTLMDLAHVINAYFDAKSPWKEVKDRASRPFLETTLFQCLEGIKTLAVIAYPILPETSSKIWEMLGLSDLEAMGWEAGLNKKLIAGASLPKPYILFPKIEDEMIENEIAKLQEMPKQGKDILFPPLKPQITIDDVQKLDLRVGQILHAEKVAKSKKLLKLEVDIGFEKRELLSGISEHYSPEELVGKKVVVVANLKPAKILGIESNGMILAASLMQGSEQHLEVLTLDEIPVGASVS